MTYSMLLRFLAVGLVMVLYIPFLLNLVLLTSEMNWSRGCGVVRVLIHCCMVVSNSGVIVLRLIDLAEQLIWLGLPATDGHDRSLLNRCSWARHVVLRLFRRQPTVRSMGDVRGPMSMWLRVDRRVNYRVATIEMSEVSEVRRFLIPRLLVDVCLSPVVLMTWAESYRICCLTECNRLTLVLDMI